MLWVALQVHGMRPLTPVLNLALCENNLPLEGWHKTTDLNEIAPLWLNFTPRVEVSSANLLIFGTTLILPDKMFGA